MGVPTAFTSSLNGLMLSVTPENVLAIRDTLATELTSLQDEYALQRTTASHVPELGPDPVSVFASAAFNRKLPDLVGQFQAVIDEVEAMVVTLTQAAHNYGLSETAIADTMHGIRPETQGFRRQLMDLTTGPLPSRSTAGSGVPGLAVDTPPVDPAVSVVRVPALIGVDPAFIRSALEPNIQVGLARP